MIVNNYNQGLYKVLLLSSAGSESLDLKHTRQVHIMELHWNYAKTNQVVGRAVRYQSHSNLPPNERFVDIYYWISIFPSHILNITADQYLMRISDNKIKIFNMFHDVIIESSIEKNYNK